MVPFPVYLELQGHRAHPHVFFECLGIAVAALVYVLLRRRFGDAYGTPLRSGLIAITVGGGVAGAKLLFWLEDPQLTWRNLHDPQYLMSGQTIVGGLAAGLLCVELAKRYIGLRQPTGDLYAIPLAVGIAIGRIGCFLTGLADNTYGTGTSLPWAVDFGDGVPRHPTQLYETLFLLLLIPVLYGVLRSTTAFSQSSAGGIGRLRAGDTFKIFLSAYLFFRLLCDFIKPYPRIFLGLGTLQLVCVVVLLYYYRDIARWMFPSAGRVQVQDTHGTLG